MTVMERYNDDPQPQYGGAEWPAPGSTIHPVSGATYPKKRKVWPWIVVGALALGGCIAGSLLFSVVGPDSAPSSLATVAPKKTTPAPKDAKPSPIKASVIPITDGTWEVGVDVAPGRYKTKGAEDRAITMCYWDTRADTSTDRIIDQGVVSNVIEPGYVTLKKGQYFHTSGCADWQPVK